MTRLRLRAGRDRPLRLGHPWILSGAVEAVEGEAQSGDTLDVVSQEGEWLARAAYSPGSRIVARVWTFDPDQTVDEGFVTRRVGEAIARREALASDARVTAYREVHAESDLVPGLIVDRYGPFRVFQLLSPGVERLREILVAFLSSDGACLGVYERSESETRSLEGLPPRNGPAWGEVPGAPYEIREYDLAFLVDMARGHKTGFYLDQRENRRRVASSPEPGQVLDAFCYTGGFTSAALHAGASHVVAIDSSASSLELARENVARNGSDPQDVEWVEGDVFHELRKLRDSRRTFDTVILDPPRFAPTASQVQRAARGYKDINLLALKLLRPGGRLYTFSCSGGVSPTLFEQIVAGAARDAGVHVGFENRLDQPDDHPVAAHFPEGRYLKGLICRKGSESWYARRETVPPRARG
jgi:23S rRNA (cytosine1962-C5)-methyltransferase